MMKINLRPWFIWGLGAAFFFIEYFARIAPSIMAPDLMRTFNVTAFGLGSLSAYFYTSYLGMQIPVGMLIDKYGLHKLLTISAFICFTTTLVWSFSRYYPSFRNAGCFSRRRAYVNYCCPLWLAFYNG